MTGVHTGGSVAPIGFYLGMLVSQSTLLIRLFCLDLRLGLNEKSQRRGLPGNKYDFLPFSLMIYTSFNLSLLIEIIRCNFIPYRMRRLSMNVLVEVNRLRGPCEARS